MSRPAYRQLLDAQPLLDDGSVRTGNSDYDALPRAMKDQYTYEDWMWLGDTEKHTLVQRETEPDY